MKVLITGAQGYVGSQFIRFLLNEYPECKIIGTDIHDLPKIEQPNYQYFSANLMHDDVKEIILDHQPQCVVHLAAVVSQNNSLRRETVYQIEVEGTKKILDACVEIGVEHFINTSSGAAYGYYADNPEYLKETDAIRGNFEFAYSWHKRKAEELFLEYRNKHPQLKQTIFRVSTILGENTRNDISNMFTKKNVLGIKGCDTPFVIIWDKDLIRILALAVVKKKKGIFNVAGDGILTLKKMSEIVGKDYKPRSFFLLKTILRIGKTLGLTPYGPEQLKFLQFRPVLDNAKLKNDFGYLPEKTTKETFIFFCEKNQEYLSGGKENISA